MRVNEAIKAKEVRLIDENGKQIGIVNIREALQIAKERGYDLVEVAPNVNPPVCKIMDYGKYKYQLEKKSSSKKTSTVKEIKIRPQISDHDLQLKVKHIKRFLEDGDKAKVTLFFRGREIIHAEMGMRVFEKIKALLVGFSHKIEQEPRLEGTTMSMIIAPGKD
ncbi:MAG: translation initiation factor IF-3 [Thermodesulfovibrio sp.]|nr:translation initiation factor IF-3 [Thermodesulfovibrio sp.]MCX7725065.1 translation initiation factor IF-3 [Thermodesulfovibrio sp.]MDW7972274.1 translation initiation factor IF-3 [Thermodesulfovibrio sp.]